MVLWQTALAVFVGTLPIFGVLVWTVMEVRGIRKDRTGYIPVVGRSHG